MVFLGQLLDSLCDAACVVFSWCCATCFDFAAILVGLSEVHMLVCGYVWFDALWFECCGVLLWFVCWFC